jgi:hypothetical protein
MYMLISRSGTGTGARDFTGYRYKISTLSISSYKEQYIYRLIPISDTVTVAI